MRASAADRTVRCSGAGLSVPPGLGRAGRVQLRISLPVAEADAGEHKPCGHVYDQRPGNVDSCRAAAGWHVASRRPHSLRLIRLRQSTPSLRPDPCRPPHSRAGLSPFASSVMDGLRAASNLPGRPPMIAERLPCPAANASQLPLRPGCSILQRWRDAVHATGAPARPAEHGRLPNAGIFQTVPFTGCAPLARARCPSRRGVLARFLWAVLWVVTCGQGVYAG